MLNKRVNETVRVWTRQADADEVARTLQVSEYDDWTYTVQRAGTGFVLEMKDEDGEHVGFWTKEASE